MKSLAVYRGYQKPDGNRPCNGIADAGSPWILAGPLHGHRQGAISQTALLLQRRIRYYWTSPTAEAAVKRLLNTLSAVEIPDTLISQYLPACWRNAMEKSLNAEELILETIEAALMNYPTPRPNP